MSVLKGYGGYGYIVDNKDDAMELKHYLAQMRKPVLEKRVAEFRDVCQNWKLKNEEIAQLLGHYPNQYPQAYPILMGYVKPNIDPRERMDNLIKINFNLSEIFSDTATKIAYLKGEQSELNGKSVLDMLKGRYVEMIEAANFVSALQESNQ